MRKSVFLAVLLLIIFLSASALDDPECEILLKHEIDHAIDCCLQDDPWMNAKWKAYLDRLYIAARRQGAIAFDAIDRHEYFAQL
mgnify:CR=1 FL=1